MTAQPTCPICGRDGVWNGCSGTTYGDVQKFEEHYRDALGHRWTVTR